METEESKEARKKHQKVFDEERAMWTEKIKVLALHLKKINTVAEAQVDLFSNRQILLEYSYNLAKIVSGINAKIRTENSRLLKQYSENSNIRYQANEKKSLIEGDISHITEKLEMVEGHRKFIDQTIQTVDHMLYGIRQRIALEEYLRNSSGSIK